MATYTGVADSNGEFSISFGANSYTGGEKVVVTAEKDAATKTIELHAPSGVIGGGVIQFKGNLTSFPLNIGVVELIGISGSIGQYTFAANTNNNSIWKRAAGLIVGNGVTSIEQYAFNEWTFSKSIALPNSLTSIATFAFSGWSAALALTIPGSVTTIGSAAFQFWSASKSLVIESGLSSIADNVFFGWGSCLNADFPNTITSFGANSCSNWTGCNEIIVRAATPPTITPNTFNSLKSTCIFKVPIASVSAYQAAANWSAFAARIQAI